MSSLSAQVNDHRLVCEPTGAHLPAQKRFPRQGNGRCKGPVAAGAGDMASTDRQLGCFKDSGGGSGEDRAQQLRPDGMSLSEALPALLGTPPAPPPRHLPLPHSLHLALGHHPSPQLALATGWPGFPIRCSEVSQSPLWGGPAATHSGTWAGWGAGALQSAPRFTAGQAWSQVWGRWTPPGQGLQGLTGTCHAEPGATGPCRSQWASEPAQP